MHKLIKTFGTDKPVIGMLHLAGGTREQKLQNAREEIDIMYGAGVDAVLVENYYGDLSDCCNVLGLLQTEYRDKVYGINYLGEFVRSFDLAEEYGAAFVQMDSVCGHLEPEEEELFFTVVDVCRAQTPVFLLGGVRFKYQPVFSGRTLEEDLAIATKHCDAIVVSGSGTAVHTDTKKIEQFRTFLPDFPLIVGAGMTAETCAEQLKIADGGIVGTYFKENGVTKNPMDAARVQEFMRQVKKGM